MNDADSQLWFLGIALGAYIIITPIVCWALALHEAHKNAAAEIAAGTEVTKGDPREEQASRFFAYIVIGALGFPVYGILCVFVASS